MDTEKIKKNIEELLGLVGEDPKREGLLDTPKRVANYYKEILNGYSIDPNDHDTSFSSEGSHDLVIVKDISFYSLCEHHMVPFFGSVAVGYLPKDKILGLSKFARIVDVYSRRLQVQERLGNQIMNTVIDILDPLGCAVNIQAKHLCMAMRGIKKDDANTITSIFRGQLETDVTLRREFLSSI